MLKWKYQMKELYNKHLDIYDCLNRIDQKDFDRILSMEETANYEDSLKAFTKYLYYHYKRKVVILIDEYDTPIVSAYEHGYY
ncbi:AAA family ATPase, partial [Fusobacterium necrophorum]|uniref:AAA family ATPase n=1 Tax=Fusobacterium necrophorum TaxID=859 RepID=UPI0021BE96D1